MARQAKPMQRRGCRLPTDMTKLTCSPKHLGLPSVPSLEFDGAFYAYYHTNTIPISPFPAATDQDDRINGAEEDVFWQLPTTSGGTWFLSDVSQLGGRHVRASYSRACIKRTQYDIGSFFFFFFANGSFLRARLLRRANVLCGKRPSGSVYGRGDVPNREARAAKCRGKAQLFNTPMLNGDGGAADITFATEGTPPKMHPQRCRLTHR